MHRMREILDVVAILNDKHGDPHKSCLNTKLELDCQDIQQQIDINQRTLEKLTRELEARQSNLQARQMFGSVSDNIQEDVSSIKQRATILTNYMEFVKSDKFSINQVRAEVDTINKECWASLKGLTDKSKLVCDQLLKMKDLHNECMELKDKTDQLMAPSH